MTGFAIAVSCLCIALAGLCLVSGVRTLAGRPLRFWPFSKRPQHPAHGWADLALAPVFLLYLTGAVLSRQPSMLALFALLGSLTASVSALLRARAHRQPVSG